MLRVKYLLNEVFKAKKLKKNIKLGTFVVLGVFAFLIYIYFFNTPVLNFFGNYQEKLEYTTGNITKDIVEKIQSVDNKNKLSETKYSANYTNRSPVNKESIEEGGLMHKNIYTNNGNIENNRTITFNNKKFNLEAEGNSSEYQVLLKNGRGENSHISTLPEKIELVVGGKDYDRNIIIDSDGLALNYNNKGKISAFHINKKGFLLEDAIKKRGIVYDGDYEDNFVDRSLVTKQYVDSMIEEGGNHTDLTQGSVAFAGIGGLITQDNQNFFWDNVNNRLGIGTNVPGGAFNIVTMTTGGSSADVTGTGTASASSEFSPPTGAAYRAFDNQTTTSGWGNNQVLPAWLQYNFGAGNSKTIVKYSLYRDSHQTGGWVSNNYSPRNWTFEGSNDGANWTVLDTQINQQISLNAAKTEFSFTNNTAYQYYRINISSAVSGSWVNITEMEMMEAPAGFVREDTFFVDSGKVGIGTSSPTAQLHTTGTVRFQNFGAGTLQTDGNGNVSVSSDERLKNIQGVFNKGLEELLNINPIEYKWKKETGYDTENSYYGFSAQNVKLSIPEAVGEDGRGYLTLSDRPILATAINAIKELNQKQEASSIKIESNTLKTDTNINTLTELQTSVDSNLAMINQTLVAVNKEQGTINSKIDNNIESLATLSENINSLTELTTTLTETVADHEERIAQIEAILEEEGIDLNNNNTKLPEVLQAFADNLEFLEEDNEVKFTLTGELIVEKIRTEEIEVGEITINSNDEEKLVVGTAIIEAGETEIKIETTKIKENSHILLTPHDMVQIALVEIKENEGFTIKIAEPLDIDLEVEWFIVQEKKE